MEAEKQREGLAWLWIVAINKMKSTLKQIRKVNFFFVYRPTLHEHSETCSFLFKKESWNSFILSAFIENIKKGISWERHNEWQKRQVNCWKNYSFFNCLIIALILNSCSKIRGIQCNIWPNRKNHLIQKTKKKKMKAHFYLLEGWFGLLVDCE